MFGSPLLSKDTEFHGNPILCGKNLFKSLDDSERIDIYKKLLMIIDSSDQILKISIRIDSGKYYGSSFKIGEMAFIFLIEKANQLMRSQKTLGLLIGDYDDPIIDVSVRQLSEYKDSGTPYKYEDIHNLIDTVHYSKSHHSRLIQLADIYVHSLQLMNAPHTQPVAQQVQEIIKTLKNKFPTKYKQFPE